MGRRDQDLAAVGRQRAVDHPRGADAVAAHQAFIGEAAFVVGFAGAGFGLGEGGERQRGKRRPGVEESPAVLSGGHVVVVRTALLPRIAARACH